METVADLICTMEYMLVQPPWNSLFTETELKIARDRLAGHALRELKKVE